MLDDCLQGFHISVHALLPDAFGDDPFAADPLLPCLFACNTCIK